VRDVGDVVGLGDLPVAGSVVHPQDLEAAAVVHDVDDLVGDPRGEPL
jgi:hypothetical protein